MMAALQYEIMTRFIFIKIQLEFSKPFYDINSTRFERESWIQRINMITFSEYSEIYLEPHISRWMLPFWLFRIIFILLEHSLAISLTLAGFKLKIQWKFLISNFFSGLRPATLINCVHFLADGLVGILRIHSYWMVLKT